MGAENFLSLIINYLSYYQLILITKLQESDWGVCYTDCPLREYQDNHQIRSVLTNLSSSFPTLATTFSLGKSVLGQELLGVRLTAGADKERALLRPMVSTEHRVMGGN